jgi:hypothetical protein
LPSSVNNFEREEIAQLAKFYDDFGGVNTVGGTANAVTITTTTIYAALATGMALWFKPTNTNTAATTLNLDAIGAKAVRKIVGNADVALTAGDLQAGAWTRLVYDATANAAAGGWIIQSGVVAFQDGTLAQPGIYFSADPDNGLRRTGTNTWTAVAGGADIAAFSSTGVAVTGQVSGTSTVAATPAMIAQNNTNAQTIIAANFVSNRPTGAIADAIGVNFILNNASGTSKTYAIQYGISLGATAGSEEGSFYWNALKAGVSSNLMRLTSSALEPISSGLIALGNSARPWSTAFVQNVSFPATQVASADPNTLDDYEEGTFTPVLTFGGASTGITYVIQGGTYTKVGNTVFYNITIRLSSKGSATGVAAVTGLPFTPGGTTSAIYPAVLSDAGSGSDFTGLTSPVSANGTQGSTSISILSSGSTGTAALTNTAFTNTTKIGISGFYPT